MGLFNHKENRDITATSPATNTYGGDGYQTGAPGTHRTDVYDPAYDNTGSTALSGNNDPYHDTTAGPTSGYNNAGVDNAYNDTAYDNQPGGRMNGTGVGAGTTGLTGNRHNDRLNDGTYNDTTFANQPGAAGTNTHSQSVNPTAGGIDNNTTTAGTNTNTGTGVGGSPFSAAGQQTTAYPSEREARHLERSGKIEKAVGTVLCSTTMKQRGLEKQVQAENIHAQSTQLAQAENLEAQAKAMRGNAVGLGAHPNHLTAGGATQPTANAGQYGNTY